ncbi:hypothetical protein FXV77_07005 [Sphingobacterium phlebotomi]|uniref:KDO2-lipid IV(A) lauroyltransferase n=1 Tax=Sphingobacterium phlebotomi TaxID=2605433 RepID=A0A5D4H779_9SPHI|nr:hypothetical protein [Sphingobacterium phlebotomi]TYR36921.1 hypothetical protein FXV77_07005 [Sphingobacterium phlebotomi]
MKANQNPEIDASAWNRSVKCIALLYQWKLLRGYTEAFRLLAHHQQWIRQAQFKTGNSLLSELEALLPICEGPRIWACFHIGPYALLARALIKRGHGVAVLLKDEVFDEQYPRYIQQFEQNFGRPPEPDELQFVRSGSTRSLIHLKQLLKKGFHVICYVDGREGGNSQKGWTTIRLHNTPMEVRIGMAILSYWTGIPLSPLILTINREGKLDMHKTESIAVKGKDHYQQAIAACYKLVEKRTAEELLQWELLPELFDHIGPEGWSPGEADPLWIPLESAGRFLLFDLASKQSVTVTKSEFLHLMKWRDKYVMHINKEKEKSKIDK